MHAQWRHAAGAHRARVSQPSLYSALPLPRIAPPPPELGAAHSPSISLVLHAETGEVVISPNKDGVVEGAAEVLATSPFSPSAVRSDLLAAEEVIATSRAAGEPGALGREDENFPRATESLGRAAATIRVGRAGSMLTTAAAHGAFHRGGGTGEGGVTGGGGCSGGSGGGGGGCRGCRCLLRRGASPPCGPPRAPRGVDFRGTAAMLAAAPLLFLPSPPCASGARPSVVRPCFLCPPFPLAQRPSTATRSRASTRYRGAETRRWTTRAASLTASRAPWPCAWTTRASATPWARASQASATGAPPAFRALLRPRSRSWGAASAATPRGFRSWMESARSRPPRLRCRAARCVRPPRAAASDGSTSPLGRIPNFPKLLTDVLFHFCNYDNNYCEKGQTRRRAETCRGRQRAKRRRAFRTGKGNGEEGGAGVTSGSEESNCSKRSRGGGEGGGECHKRHGATARKGALRRRIEKQPGDQGTDAGTDGKG